MQVAKMQRSEIWLIKPSTYWSYKADIEQPLRRKVNGKKPVKQHQSPRGRGKLRGVVAIEDTGSPSSISRKGSPSSRSWAGVMSQVTSAPSSKEYEAAFSLLESSTY